MLETNDLLTTVIRNINELLEEAEHEHDDLTGDEALNAIGLNSLLLARLVIQLEMELGVDPFAEGELVIADVRTVGELAGAYADALGGTVAA